MCEYENLREELRLFMRMALSYAVIIKGLGGGRMQGYQLPLLAAELLLMFFFFQYKKCAMKMTCGKKTKSHY